MFGHIAQPAWCLLLLLLLMESCAAHLSKIPLRRKTPGFLKPTQATTPVPLHGDFPKDGEYFVDVTIGKQALSLLIDTGSSDVGVSAVGCHGCTQKAHDSYDPSKSPNASSLGCDWCAQHVTNQTCSACKDRGGPTKQCTFRVSYDDKSGFSAAVWTDDFQINSMPSTRSVVGAMYEASFPNPKSIDGIIGLADKGLSDSGATTPIDDLVAAGAMDNIFGLCLEEQGGSMYLGSSADELIAKVSTGGVQWTPRVINGTPGLYVVNTLDITVAGISIGVSPEVYNAGGAIVDSGTSQVALPRTAFNALRTHFAGLCRNASLCLKGVCDCQKHTPLKVPIFNSERCVDMEPADVLAYPLIEVHFGGDVVIPFPPTRYLSTGATFCPVEGQFTISIGPEGPDGSGTIFGDTFMRGFTVLHDRRTPERIGFAPVASSGSCP